MFSCKKDNVEPTDETAPGQISDISVTPLNTEVKMNWTNPSDQDFKSVILKVAGDSVEIDKTFTGITVGNLTNGTEYIFTIYTTDESGNSSEPVEVKATPDKYVTKLIADDISSGTYELLNTQNPTTITINNNQYLKEMATGSGYTFFWDGIWAIENDTTYLLDVEYKSTDPYGTQNHIANLEERHSGAFNYSLNDSTFYIEDVYMKTEGSDDFLQGDYKYYIKTVSDDAPSYNDTVYFYLNVNENGNMTYSSIYGSETDTWENIDLLNGKYIFINYNSITYLIVRGKTKRYYKN
jgi:hypothetical protein